MCRESLFYFGLDMDSHGVPQETCLHHAKKYMMENGIPYTVMTVLLAINSFWIFLFTFCMFRRQTDEKREAKYKENERDFDGVGGQGQPEGIGQHFDYPPQPPGSTNLE